MRSTVCTEAHHNLSREERGNERTARVIAIMCIAGSRAASYFGAMLWRVHTGRAQQLASVARSALPIMASKAPAPSAKGVLVEVPVLACPTASRRAHIEHVIDAGGDGGARARLSERGALGNGEGPRAAELWTMEIGPDAKLRAH